jgi:hypothetical protein
MTRTGAADPPCPAIKIKRSGHPDADKYRRQMTMVTNSHHGIVASVSILMPRRAESDDDAD